MTNPAGEPQLEIERIVQVFASHDVEYLLIGGVATLLYGAQRLTYDLDVVASRDLDNLDRMAARCETWGHSCVWASLTTKPHERCQ